MKTISLLTIVFGFIFPATHANAAPTSGEPRSIEPKEVMGMLLNDFAVIVDVREAEERTAHENGHRRGDEFLDRR